MLSRLVLLVGLIGGLTTYAIFARHFHHRSSLEPSLLRDVSTSILLLVVFGLVLRGPLMKGP